GVGKTSLVRAFLGQNTKSRNESVLPPVVLPVELNSNYPDINTVIIDTSSEDSSPSFRREIQEASVVLLVYDIWREETIDILNDKWMPIISSVNREVPIILVANKKDTEEYLEHSNRVQPVMRLMVRKWRQVQMGLECSVHKNLHISSILYCAQKVVLYPMGVLYDLSTHEITQDFRRALHRIFAICDVDADGWLSDEELVRFQEQVFEGELGKDDIRTIKELIRQELALDRVDQISFEGFVALQKKCIELLKIQTCWTVLRHFGYDDSLRLKEDGVKEDLPNTASGESIELSPESLRFLSKEFFRHASHSSLPLDRLPQVFFAQNAEVFPEPRKHIYMKNQDSLELEEWLMLWHLLWFEDVMWGFKVMRYLGFVGSLADACQLTNPKGSYRGLQRTTRRTVISVAILGHRQSEFTEVVNSLGIGLGTYRRKVILKNSGGFGCRLFILKEVPEDEWLNFFHGQHLKFDLLVYTANRE
ncbi:uncharacterized protein LOC127594957, partial [Hippocampus zosterae]|uniref:uncharacterized protein LOC127594957 n=1 Tax=Hippocampus zosterae TaxID=109293 RepID=UPI00223E2F8F